MDATARTYSGCSPHEAYTLGAKIGEGTFGEVSLAVHNTTLQKVALKRVIVHSPDEGVPVTALREIRILKALRHHNIVELRDVAATVGDRLRNVVGELSMVFPYLEHDLTGLLENPQVAFTPNVIKSFVKQLLTGVSYMHKSHILHRDIKASNILVSDTGVVKIADFGLARTFTVSATDGFSVAKLTNMVVTRWYRPPELCMGERRYSGGVDVWGVGCVFGELLKRRPILAGATDVDQLAKIFKLCGTPTVESWPGLIALPDIKSGALKLPFLEPSPSSIRDVFPAKNFHRKTVDFLECLLKLDPSKRPSAEMALTHDYFFTPPAAAKTGTSDFQTWKSSHEMDAKIRREANLDSRHHLPSHFDAQIVDREIADGERASRLRKERDGDDQYSNRRGRDWEHRRDDETRANTKYRRSGYDEHHRGDRENTSAGRDDYRSGEDRRRL